MNDELDILEKLRKEFVFTAKEDLEEISNDLSDLERNFSIDTHSSIARSIHSLKGSAGSFEIDELVTLTHCFEEVFNYLDSELVQNEYLFSLIEDMLLILNEFLKHQTNK